MSNSRSQKLTSVGIDIGTTTTQLVISSLTIENTSPLTSIPRMEIRERKVLYRSRIYNTPVIDHELIDARSIAAIVEGEYRVAGFQSEEIATGAVIITGETAKKENARSLLEALAGLAGDFVVATAGPHLESIYAGKGSGAAAYSRENSITTVNIDVGGGTSNIAVFRNGHTVETACVNVGGHLLEIAPGGDRITYIADPARLVLRECGLELQPGDRVTLDQLRLISSVMAGCVMEVVAGRRELSVLARGLLMTPPLSYGYQDAAVMFSGGVADEVYVEDPLPLLEEITRYGDLGPQLGRALRVAFEKEDFKLVKPRETIRATVIGAGTQAVNISGSTIQVNPDTLPLRNVMVLSPFISGVPEKPGDIEGVLQQKLARLHQDGCEQNIALFLKGPRTNRFPDIQSLADGVVRGMDDYLTERKPLVVVLEDDCGKVLGQCLQSRLGKGAEIVCIDQVVLDEGDYIDIGKPVMGGSVVPVVVKTLVFNSPAAPCST